MNLEAAASGDLISPNAASLDNHFHTAERWTVEVELQCVLILQFDWHANF